MSQRITFELVQRNGSRTVALRGVWQPFATQGSVTRSLVRRIQLPEGTTLGEQELWELATALEQEILGWAAKLPLGYLE